MNLHFPQGYPAMEELRSLMAVKKNLLTPQSNRPIVSIIQDTLLGAYLMSRENIFLERYQVYDMIYRVFKGQFDGNIPTPTIIKPKPLWTGKQMLSMIIPDINMNALDFNRMDHDKVCIRRGELLVGYMNKSVLGKKERGLIHRIVLQEGENVAGDFVSKIGFLVTDFMTQHSFSTGIEDCCVDKDVMQQVQEELQVVVNECSDWNMPEKQKNQRLNMARDTIAKSVIDKLGPHHGMNCMVQAGSKGSYTNIAQIAVCCGQQNLEGKRIPYTSNGRTLPHYTKDTQNPVGRGFVVNNYMSGLKPEEFFFHMVGGREGLVDT